MENKNTFFPPLERYDDGKVNGLWVIVNEYNISKLYDVADEDLEDKLRYVLGCFTVVQIRSLCKRMSVRKVSGIKKKHELIDAVISWGKKQTDKECELRRYNRLELFKLTNAFKIPVEIPVDVDKVVKDIIEFMDARKVDWFWIYEILEE